MIRKTKIIATIGPATSERSVLKRIIEKGVNVCRLNFSHINHEDAKEIISTIKSINQELNVHTAILADLQGPKIRIGKLERPLKIKSGQELVFTTKTPKKNQIFIGYKSFAKDVSPGENILIDDGKIKLKVLGSNNKDQIITKVVVPGVLSSFKGVNLPNTKISLPCLTPKDKKDLTFILKEKIEWLALSFVREAQDLISLRKILKRNKSKIGVISKIEKPEAIKNIDEIITYSNAIMVARGDLGVEIPPHRVPAVQKNIVKKAVERSRPVIIATQMLESMTYSPVATRAEVNDVANSVIDGADAVMLSGETSVGKYPVKTVDTMRKIIRDIEKSDYVFKPVFNQGLDLWLPKDRQISNSICQHASQLSEQTRASAIICMTHSGYNAIKISSLRPTSFVHVFTNNYSILNKLSLVWGVQAYYYDREATTDQTIIETKEILRRNKYIKKGEYIINLASMPAHEKGMTNMVKLSKV
ncbi:pyruvate kinase [Flavobacteriales bacterium]|nr:pyruvate kinase [Flavobacteriales bacterium]